MYDISIYVFNIPVICLWCNLITIAHRIKKLWWRLQNFLDDPRRQRNGAEMYKVGKACINYFR